MTFNATSILRDVRSSLPFILSMSVKQSINVLLYCHLFITPRLKELNESPNVGVSSSSTYPIKPKKNYIMFTLTRQTLFYHPDLTDFIGKIG